MIDIRLQILTVMGAVVFALTTFVNPTFASVQVSAQEESSMPISSTGFGFGADFPFGDLLGQFFGAKYDVTLDGAQEVLGGDIDGTGEAEVRIREDKHSFSSSKSEICVDIKADYIEQASGVHIHHAPKGSTGTVVINLPILDAEGKADGCVQVDQALLKKINANPQDYYINIHTNPYPDGAIRGQLSE